MLSFGNKEFRNLQEQVLKNMKDIQDIEEGATVLADFGIAIVGQVADASNLPNPSTYEGEYGDAYIVGSSAPYNYYIFTRAFEGQENPSWFNLGQFPVPGPQGQTGPQGATGATPIITATVGSTSTLNPGAAATASVTKSGTNENPTLTFNFAIPQGAQGIQGPAGAQGPTGPQGVKGDKGDKGEQGGLIEIVGIVATANDLPAPATLQKLDAAYLVGSSPDYELYVQVGEAPSTALWTNLGYINEGTVVTENGVAATVWDADTKVSVSDGYLMDTLYGQAAGTGNGQTHVPYGSAATSNYIVQRDNSGQILVPATPTGAQHATSKSYVDNAVSAALPTEQAGDLIVGTSTAHSANRLAIGSAGQYLKVNSNADGLEYGDVDVLPTIQSGDAGKVLAVNGTETGTEWATVSGGDSSIIKDITTLTANSKIKNTAILTQSSSANVYASSGSNTNANSNFYLINSLSRTSFGQTEYVNSYGNLCIESTIPSSRSSGYYAQSYGNIFLNTTARYGFLHAGNYNGCIFSGNPTTYALDGTTSTTSGPGDSGAGIYSCLLIGALNGLSTSFNGTNAVKQNSYKFLLGVGLYNARDNHTGINGNIPQLITGQYNNDLSSDKDSHLLVVGAGTSASARANCFATGNDGTNDYIYIGDTKLTEAQLTSLLALL